MYSREEVRAITDKVLSMASRATGAEVDFSGGERSATRFANSTITANIMQFDRQVNVTVRQGTRSGSASTRQFDDASLQEMVNSAMKAAEGGRENPNMEPLLGPQTYVPVDAALPAGVTFGPTERARLAKASIDVSDKMKTVGSGYIPASIQLGHEWKYFASSEGSYLEQEVYTTTPNFTVTARKKSETQTNRESAHFVGEKESRGCTSANSWRDYPFLRMPNVHVDAGPKGSPTPEEMIADTRDGVMIDGRGSYSIDQQRYNGQFGGNAFWEIKNGKRTRMVTNVTYNAITTEFWANLDAISGKEHWQMFGTGGDAKGQPTQTNSISHGSPWLRIRRIMVGGAFA